MKFFRKLGLVRFSLLLVIFSVFIEWFQPYQKQYFGGALEARYILVDNFRGILIFISAVLLFWDTYKNPK